MKEHIAHSGAWGIALIVIVAFFGEGIVHWPTIFSVALFPIIVLSYFLLARSEERKVVEQFGDEYRAYRKRVPMFIPRWGQWRNLATTRSGTPAASFPDTGKNRNQKIVTTTRKDHDHERIEIRDQRPHLRHDRGRSNRFPGRTRWQDVLLLLRRLSAKFLFTPAGAKPRLRLVAAVDSARTL